MLMPTCSNSASPSKSQNADRPSAWYQRASRAFSTNQPSLFGTVPFSVVSTCAAGTMRRRLPKPICGYPRGNEASNRGRNEMLFHRQSRMDRVKGALKEAASYSDALARDGRLRSDLRAAIGHGSVASQRIRRDFAAGRITTRLARDRKLRRNVRELFHDLERASERIQN